MDKFIKDSSLMNGKGEEDDNWITINGTHIHIEDGESIEEAMERYFGSKQSINLPKQEYAELCSSIRTKYGNKIPERGSMLYNYSYYVYNYSKRTYKITCADKMGIDGNEELILFLEGIKW